jgi:hypothetical protein
MRLYVCIGLRVLFCSLIILIIIPIHWVILITIHGHTLSRADFFSAFSDPVYDAFYDFLMTPD